MTRKQEDLKWQAESDASTLAQYQEIMEDKSRMNRAIKAAKERAKDLSTRASMMQKASNISKSSIRKSTKRK